ncbi:hypothetical protein [Roseiflexus castenholzii]|uniref:hypothetical protein n=1 Tax=Roseiflexus castenholzii TaxID=120962 RepID=UPI0023580303
MAAFRPAPPEGWTVLATVDTLTIAAALSTANFNVAGRLATVDTLTIAAAPPGNEYAAVTGADECVPFAQQRA